VRVRVRAPLGSNADNVTGFPRLPPGSTARAGWMTAKLLDRT